MKTAMKTMKKVAAGCLLVILFFFCVIVVRFIIWDARVRNRWEELEACDHEAVLAACRDMISEREAYRSSPNCRSGSGEMSNIVYLDGYLGPWGDEIPLVIRNLNPRSIRISEDRVMVKFDETYFPFRGPRIGFIGLAENANEESVQKLGAEGSTKFIDDLWRHE